MLRKENNQKYQHRIRNLARYLEEEGFCKIAANAEGFKLPTRIRVVNPKEEVLPDLTAEINGKLFVFEIQGYTKQLHISRWKTLSHYTREHGGQFFLLAPEEVITELTDFLENVQLDAVILPMAEL